MSEKLAEHLEGVVNVMGLRCPNAFATFEKDRVLEAAALLRSQEAREDEIREEAHREGYDEGAADQSGWATDTSHAVIAWLTKNGDAFDPDHPDGITTDVVVQALYDAVRAAAAQASRSQAERIAKLEEGLERSEKLHKEAVASNFAIVARHAELTDRLREALRPFADYLPLYEKKLADDFGVRVADRQMIHGDTPSAGITVGDLRRARAVLSEKQP